MTASTHRSSSSDPLFCSSVDKEFPSLMAQYITHNNPLSAKPQNLIHSELSWDLQKIMRNYLVDFWRHEVEKNEGGRRLWEQITGTNMYNNWWVEPQDVNKDEDGKVKKTRWQEVAEQLFCTILGLPSFSCTSQHINLLIQLREKSGKRKDTELVSIIDNYISSTS